MICCFCFDETDVGLHLLAVESFNTTGMVNSHVFFPWTCSRRIQKNPENI